MRERERERGESKGDEQKVKRSTRKVKKRKGDKYDKSRTIIPRLLLSLRRTDSTLPLPFVFPLSGRYILCRLKDSL